MTQPIDWKRVYHLSNVSRLLDEIEETKLVPEKKVAYQFTARGHDVPQIILGQYLNHPHDAVSAYYRSRPLLLTLGLSIDDAFAGSMGKSGGFSDGRDIGVVSNLPNMPGPVVLPMSGDVGSQYTPCAGWAQAITYHRDVLGNRSYEGAIGCVLGGDASVATNGFWAALTMATTLKLPMLFYIEDNGYGISVPSHLQTPGANIADNLASFRNLRLSQGDGTSPAEASRLFAEAVASVRAGHGAAMVRLTVPRLSGHSGQDTQTYKPADLLTRERANDPLPKLRAFLAAGILSESELATIESLARQEVEAGLASALARPEPSLATITRHRFDDEVAIRGGLAPAGHTFPPSSEVPAPDGARINLLTAVRRALDSELRTNPKALLFGEDVGPKGGVHAATLGLQDSFGDKRGLRHQPVRGRHHRAGGRDGAGGPDADCRDPVPEVRRPGHRAAQQLRDDPVADQQPVGRPDRRADAGRICPQMWRPVAQCLWRGGLGPRGRLAGSHPVERGRCGRVDPNRDAQQQSHHLLRASSTARRNLGQASLSGRPVRGPVRESSDDPRRRQVDLRHLGRDGGAVRSRRQESRLGRPCP